MDTTIKKKQKKQVADTSVAAFNETAMAHVTEKHRIIDFIAKHPGASREEIAEGTGMKLQSCTGNVTALVRNGHISEEGGKLNKGGRKVHRLWPFGFPIDAQAVE
jgi:DNA-binding MarR family transcriptional regulator